MNKEFTLGTSFYFVENNRVLVDVVQHIQHDVYLNKEVVTLFEGQYFSFTDKDIDDCVFFYADDALNRLGKMELMEDASIIKDEVDSDSGCGIPTDEEFELIRKLYVRPKYLPKDIFVFKVKLCNNDVDSCYERITISALEQLSQQYLGVTGMIDDTPICRIFDCRINPVPDKTTQSGDDFFELIAKAYIIRNEQTKHIISKIQSKEISSVNCGFSVVNTMCNICNRNIHKCTHKPGKTYDGKLCCNELSEVADVYDFSFKITGD